MTKPKITASDIRIRGNEYNWMLCYPQFNKDGTPKLTTGKNGGEHYFQPFAYFSKLEFALSRWFDLLMTEGFTEKAGDVRDVMQYCNKVEERFLQSTTAPEAHDLL